MSTPPLVRVCEVCGAEYRAWPYEAANGRRYCGYSCRSKARARPVAARFWAKTVPWEGCLLWTDTPTRGRPRIKVGGGVAQAPRLAYELVYGPVPPGAHVRHLCRHTFCVRPEHLVIAFDPGAPLADRFWSRVRIGEGCWLWQGGHDERGSYGVLMANGRKIRAHRLAWELTHGAIPTGLVVCHRCDVRDCVRPDHLFLGTVAENNQDMRTKGRAVAPPRPVPKHVP